MESLNEMSARLIFLHEIPPSVEEIDKQRGIFSAELLRQKNLHKIFYTMGILIIFIGLAIIIFTQTFIILMGNKIEVVESVLFGILLMMLGAFVLFIRNMENRERRDTLTQLLTVFDYTDEALTKETLQANLAAENYVRKIKGRKLLIAETLAIKQLLSI